MLNDPTGAEYDQYGRWHDPRTGGRHFGPYQDYMGGSGGGGSVGADGMTNEQWLNASRPDAPPGLAHYYASQNWHYQQTMLYEARKGNADAAKAYGAMNGDLQTVYSAGAGIDNSSTIIHYTLDGITYIDVYVDPRVQTQGDPGLRLLASTTLVKDGDFKTESGDFKFLGGQHVRIELTNMNILGVQIDLADQSRYYVKKTWLGTERKVYSGDSHSLLLLPGQTKSFDFYQFDYSPMLWQFGLDSQISDAVNVRVRIYSTWIPGDPIDPNHPYKNELGPK